MTLKIDSAVIEIMEPDAELDPNTICRACNLSSEVLVEWVEAGVVEPRVSARNEWRFSVGQLRRARAARRLQRDLELQTTSLPVVLDLLEELHQLRRRLATLERLVED